jgi:hypothetical protein
LIIIKSLDDPEKIIGRAILWTDSKDRKFMDRIYVIDHPNVVLFIEYAQKMDINIKGIKHIRMIDK